MISILMFDIVTVVFQDELGTLKAQAQSVDLYCQGIGIQNIFVVVNDEDLVAQQINPAWWGTLSCHVKIIPRSEFRCAFAENGWVSQQVLKVLGTALSTNRYCLVLDAKTIFLRTLELDYIFAPDGRISLGYYPIQPVFLPAQQIVSNLFNIDLRNVAGPMGVPFVFDVALIRLMIKTVTQLTNCDFAEWFQGHNGLVTEFILYTGFVLYHHSDLDTVYAQHNAQYLITNICHSQIDVADDLLQVMPSSLTVSVHRNAWNQFSQQQKDTYRQLLVNHQITVAGDML